MDYKERLRQFNSTEKYKSEMDFVLNIMEWRNNYTKILDVGCGIGTFMDKCGAYGYDVNSYYEGDRKEMYYLSEWPQALIHDISMLHSISHIPNTKNFLRGLKERFRHATITVITPNASWLNIVGDTKSDPTVIKHYTQDELKELFESAGYKISLIGQFGEEKNGINERIFLQAK